MLISRCRQLRPALTSYVDDEVSEADRRLVEEHLRRCQSCRRRVGRQEAVHHLLRRRSNEARLRGAPVAWSPRAYAPGRATGSTLFRRSLVAAAGLAVGLGIWVPWRAVPLAARGYIRDSTCGGGHAHTTPELQKMAGRDCVRLCVELGAQYIFVSNGVTFPIRNQAFADLARFAEQDVEVEGQVWGKRLTVSHVRPLPGVAHNTPTALTPRVIPASVTH